MKLVTYKSCREWSKKDTGKETPLMHVALNFGICVCKSIIIKDGKGVQFQTESK